MRTTVNLADDVAAAVEQRRSERSIGMSDAVNDLIRAGLTGGARRKRFEQRTQPLALRVDVLNVAEALETLDGPSAR